MAELYGPVLERQEGPSPTDHLPLVGELPRLERFQLALSELHSLARWFGDFRLENIKNLYTAETEGVKPAVRDMHYVILQSLAQDAQQLSAYQLGRALFDTCWLPGTVGSDSETFIVQFERSRLARLRTWMTIARPVLPPQSPEIAAISLQNWQGWTDVNVGQLLTLQGWWNVRAQVLDALQNQASAWYALLTSEPAPSGASNSVSAWLYAGESAVRAARILGRKIIRAFWPVALAISAATGVLLYFTFQNSSGIAKVWTSLITLAGALGASALSLRAALPSAVVETRAWEVTWLPTLALPLRNRYRLYRRGIVTHVGERGIQAASPWIPDALAGSSRSMTVDDKDC